MAPVLYSMPVSPAGRAILITAKAIGLKLEEKHLDLFRGEHLTPEFLKLNPQHTIPVFVDDDGTVICDSHATNTYIVSKYAQNDSLYPKDSKARAVVDQRLHFDTGVAYIVLRQIVVPMHFNNKKEPTAADMEDTNKVYSFLEAFLDGNEWIAGDSLTIADYHLYTTVNGLAIFEPVQAEKYPRVAAWLLQVGSRPEIEVDRKGNKEYIELMHSRMAK